MSSLNVAIVVTSPPSTSITFTPSAQSLVAPVPAGANLGHFAVAPQGWTGTLTPSGADAALFALDTSLNLLVGATALSTARTYNVTVTANP